MKKIAKSILTFIYHPIVTICFLKKGIKRFVIGSRIQINSFKYLSISEGLNLGKDSRFMFVSEYHGGKYNPLLKIGKNVCIGNRFTILCAEPIIIEDNCLLASDVLITSENHGINPEISLSYSELPLTGECVKIGKGTWIGEKVSILPGVEIGEKCIIATGAVVTHSCPAYCMMAGVPARIIKRYDFDKHEWIKLI